MKILFFDKKISPRIFFILLVLLATISLFVFINFKSSVDSEINIQININRKTAQEKAKAFLEDEIGVNVGEYKNVTYFSSNNSTKNFLDKNFTASQAGELMNDEINVWSFQTRFFIPEEQEEYYVKYDNLGRFSAYYFEIPEEKEGAKLEEEQAKNIAVNFIKKHYYENLDNYTLVENDSSELDERKDYDFTWEHDSINLNGAKKRIIAGVGGDEMVYFRSYLKIPEDWSRQEIKTNSSNSAAQTFAEVLTFLFIYLPMFYFFVKLFKKRQFDNKFSLKVGSIVGVITLLTLLNTLPTLYSAYSTLETWANFLAGQVFGFLVAPVLAVVGTWLTVLVCEAYFRDNNPEKNALKNLFTRSFFQQKSYKQALIVGFLSGFIIAAYQILYYFIVKKFGFWSPSVVSMEGAYFGLLPWLMVLVIGFLPALSEEIVFRMFGITFFKKILKKTWLAVLFTSLIWAFLHSAYPQQPFFARGLELLPIGIMFSYLYINFGILSSFTAHYTLNSLLSLPFLMKLGYINSAASLFLFLLPLILAVVLYIMQKRFANPASLLKNSEHSLFLANKKIENKIEKVNKLSFIQLGKNTKNVLLVLLVIGLISFIYVSFYSYTEDLKIAQENIKRKELISKSDLLMRDIEQNPKDFMVVANYYNSFSGTDYLLDLPRGKEVLREIYNNEIPASLWSVKYFKPMEKEKYIFSFTSDGKFYDYNHIIPDSQPGESLSQEDAIKLAEENLKLRTDIDFSDYEFSEINESKKDNRMDYWIEYKNKNIDLGDGYLKIFIEVKGDEVVNFDKYIDIPDEWGRNQIKSNMKDFVVGVISFIVGLFFVVYTIFIFLKMYRDGSIELKKNLYYVFAISILSIILFLNSLPTFYLSYNGIESLNIFLFKKIALYLLGGIFGLIIFLLLFSYAKALFYKYISDKVLPEEADKKKWVIFDALLISYSLGFFFYFIALAGDKIYIFFDDKFNLHRYMFTLPEINTSLNDYFPFLTDSISYINDFVLFVPLGILFIALFYKFFKRWIYVWLSILLLGILSAFAMNDIKEIIFNLVLIFSLMLVLLPFGFIFKRNIFAIIPFVYVMEILSRFVFVNMDINRILLNLLFFILLILPFALYFLYYKINIIEMVGKRSKNL